MDSTDPSDAESDADSDEPSNIESGSLKSVIDSPKRNLNNSTGQSKLGQMSTSRKNLTGGLICRRSGASGVGSLVIFRLHAALSDDGKAVVHLLTSCLADSSGHRTQSPSHTPKMHVSKSSTFAERDGDDKFGPSEFKRKWRGYNPSQADAGSLKHTEHQPSFNIGSPKTPKPSGLPLPLRGPTNACHVKPETSGSNSNPADPCELSSSFKYKQTKSSNDLDNMNHSLKNETNSNSKIQTSEFKSTDPNRINSPGQFDTIFPDEDDPEESEAAQWWYTFWASSLATIATFCDLIRALLTGPAIILHRYFLTQADMGILVKTKNPSQKIQMAKPAQCESHTKHTCILLSLAKMSRIRQVTKASYAEIILSLLAGGLRAYHQIMGLKHPPDLLALLATEVPVLPGCNLTDLKNSSSLQLNSGDSADAPCPTLSRIRLVSQRMRPLQSTSNTQIRHEQYQPSDGVAVETGLLGAANRMVALGPPPTAISSLRPGRHVLADICLPINTEGMLPRLWETRQRLIELNTSIDALCLAWTRSVLYTLLPHSLAKWFESSYGGPARSSVCVAGIEVVSPFSGHNTGKDSDGSNCYQMPRTRRLAYMSLLANKSAEARILRRRLCKRLPRGVAVYPPRLGTSFRALARHLVNANAGIVYISGSPIIRIDTWMPSATDSLPVLPCQTLEQSNNNNNNKPSSDVCRNLSVTFTTYAGQLSVSLSAGSKDTVAPNLEVISQAMTSQLNKMCRLLSGRHVPSLASRWLHRGSGFESAIASSSAVNMSPSLNPSLTLHSEAMSADKTETNNRGSNKPFTNQANSTTVQSPRHQSASNYNRGNSSTSSQAWNSKNTADTRQQPMSPSSSDPTKSTTVKLPPSRPIATYAFQDSQPIEQLQDRLRWVQQQLEEASTGKPQGPSTDNERLAKLRSEFCILLKHLKQRCNQSETAILAATRGTVATQGITDDKNLSHDKRIRSISKTMSSPLITTASELLSVKSKLEQYATAKSGGSGTTTGDFDEDPDFCINGYNETDEEFEDELESSESDFTINEESAVSKFGFQPAACVLSDEINGGHQVLPQQGIQPSGSIVPKKSKERKSRKSKRKGSRLLNKRRSSFLTRDVKALDFTPNRRGSLTTPQTEKDNLLAKFLKKTKGPSTSDPS